MAIDATFEDVPLPGPESFYNGSDSAGGFTSGSFRFDNTCTYDPVYGWWWKGWACSNVTDTTIVPDHGVDNQYSAIPGRGEGGSSNYGVSYGHDDPWDIFGRTRMTLTGGPRVVDGAYFTNTAWAYYSMLNGDTYAKKFGGATGDDGDYFLLTITGLNGETETGTVNFYLADYGFADNSLDYIIDEWTWVDLTGLGEVTSLEFDLDSSDKASGFLNTPAYFAMDNMVPEPASMLLLTAGAMALLRRHRNRPAK